MTCHGFNTGISRCCFLVTESAVEGQPKWLDESVAVGDSLEEFLASRREGEYESSGVFEISGDKALEKLARYSATQPATWLLKLIQGAVLAGGSRLEVKSLKGRIRLQVHGGSFPDFRVQVDTLLNPERTCAPLLNELNYGLRSLLTTEFSLSWPREPRRLTWRNGRFSWESGAVEEHWTVEARLPSDRKFLSATIGQLLNEKAGHCPIPLFLDGRPVEPRSVLPDSHLLGHDRFSPRWLGAGYLGSDGGLGESELETTTLFKAPLRCSRPLLYWPRLSPSSSTFSLWVSHRDGVLVREKFELRWTRFGILAGRCDLAEGPLGGYLQVSGDHMPSDLSLAVRPEDVEQARQGGHYLLPVCKTIGAILLEMQPGLTLPDLIELGGRTLWNIGSLAASLGIVCLGIPWLLPTRELRIDNADLIALMGHHLRSRNVAQWCSMLQDPG